MMRFGLIIVLVSVFLVLFDKISFVTSDYITTVFAGGGSDTTGKATIPTNIKFGYISDILADASENVYLVDFTASAVYQVSSTNILSIVAGYPYNFGFSGDGGPAQYSLFTNPRNIALKRSTNELFISDYNNCRIRKVSIVLNNKIDTIVGGNGCYNSGDYYYANYAFIDKPTGLAYSPYNDRLFIASGSYLRYVDFSTGFINSLVANRPYSRIACDNAANIYGLSLLTLMIKIDSTGAETQFNVHNKAVESFSVDPYTTDYDGVYARDSSNVYKCSSVGGGCSLMASINLESALGDIYVSRATSRLYLATASNIVYVVKDGDPPTQSPTRSPSAAPTFKSTPKQTSVDKSMTFTISQTIGGLSIKTYNSFSSYKTTLLATIYDTFGAGHPVLLSNIRILSAKGTSAALRAEAQSTSTGLGVIVDESVTSQATGVIFLIQIYVPSTAKLGYVSPDACFDALASTYLANVQSNYFDIRLSYNAQVYGSSFFIQAYAVKGSVLVSVPTYNKANSKKKASNIISIVTPLVVGICVIIAGIFRRMTMQNSGKVGMAPAPGPTYANATAPALPGQIYLNNPPSMSGQAMPPYSTQAYPSQPYSSGTIGATYPLGGTTPAYSVTPQYPQMQGQSGPGYYGAGGGAGVNLSPAVAPAFAMGMGSTSSAGHYTGVPPAATIPMAVPLEVEQAGVPYTQQPSDMYHLPPSHPLYQANQVSNQAAMTSGYP